jgi:hypothetical protein
MTIKSVTRLIRMFLHALCTVVGAFFILYCIGIVILRYGSGMRNPFSIAAWPFIPAMIFAAVYTLAGTAEKASELFEGVNITIKSVVRMIGRFVHVLCTLVGAFFILYDLGILILQYGAGVNPISIAAWTFIPAMIFAAVYTWMERPTSNRTKPLSL